MALALEHYQGRRGHSAMFTEGFLAGHYELEDVPHHFVRIGGASRSHPAGEAPYLGHGYHGTPGVNCQLCMATAAQLRQWVESLDRYGGPAPSHER